MMRLSTLLLLSFLFLGACYEYEPEISTFSYRAEDYLLSDAVMEDWGPHTADHYNMDFTLIGANSKVEVHFDSVFWEYYVTLSEDHDWLIFIELFSPGTEGFVPGVYRGLGTEPIEEIGEEEFIFRRILFSRVNRRSIYGREGTVKVTIDNAGIYRFWYDVTLTNGEQLKGYYAGAPVYRDMRDTY